MKKKVVFTITNDMLYDQRMQKICSTLAENKYSVLLLGFKKIKPPPQLNPTTFHQIRLPVMFLSGPLFFIEANLRIFFYLLFKKFDIICAVDLDTIIPAYLLSVVKRKKRVFDAHELFCETHELVLKPRIRKIWKSIEQFFLPRFKKGYTVNQSLANEYKAMYHLNYQVIRNLPKRNALPEDRIHQPISETIIYQGAVSKGRGIEYVIPAMQNINMKLVICGNGDFFKEAQQLIKTHGLENKVEMKGLVRPEELLQITSKAAIGLNTIEGRGKSYFLSLSNRTFDYINAGIPQIAMNYPEYQRINNEFEVAVLIDQLDIPSLVSAINKLSDDENFYRRLQQNCHAAIHKLNWENEKKKLIAFYDCL